LFGRWTYEQLLAHWNQHPDSPFTPALNNTPKYVVSTTLSEPLPWPNSTLVTGDITEGVRTVKKEADGVVAIMGSGTLIAHLMAANLIDEYLLMIHPLVLGTGRRLFPEGVSPSLRLTSISSSESGVAIAIYEPARDHT
jgi:dihydrofolate reductase